MQKILPLIGLLLLANSVLAPDMANAQTVPNLVTSSSTSTTTGMTTNQAVQDSATTTAPVNYSVTLTSYNAVPAQTSPTPWVTASGARSNSQVIAARSRDLSDKLPYGTIIAIDGPSLTGGATCGYDSVSHLIGYRVIADSMAARMHNKVDVMLNQYDTVSHGGKQINPAIALGACTGVSIHVVGYVDPQHIPSTQTALADLVTSGQSLAFAKF
jgi:3D (Asp-Asp-Asp) domain-containing protein